MTVRWAFSRAICAAALWVCLPSCKSEKPQADPGEPDHSSRPPDQSKLALGAEETRPEALYVPVEAQSAVDLSRPGHEASRVGFLDHPVQGPHDGACPSDMVSIMGDYCIDRFEVSLVDAASSRELSPHYPPRRKSTELSFLRWSREAPDSRGALASLLSVPPPPDFQLTENFAPRARSERDVLPAGYLSRDLAERACQSAGKRLCRRHEWVRACRGQQNQRFPYGDSYRQGKCNIHRLHHPATLLHGDPSKNHSDPRLGLTSDEDGPLLRKTGTTESCKSTWGQDAVYDMVGNLDEWIEDPEGVFLGGFFSRATTSGCAASIESHSPDYWDYSLGTRCCKDAD